ncbi:TIGR04255 family protein [Chondromyces apiculatus]|uniref:TIGR04255 family protein n=1 Tax=Chondromyces apiculatus TaxID=51 RepID=UPI0018CC309B|nr:TIGR04255 family protein [Chondromyces apiculatus]
MSSPYPHLSQAPITEALLDIRVVQDPETTASTLQGFSSSVDRDVLEARPIHRINDQLTADPGLNDVSGSTEVLGNIYWNADHSRAVQARVDGFSVNCVGSYTDWEALREQARTLWQYLLPGRATAPGAAVRAPLHQQAVTLRGRRSQDTP